jgi:hypothetical protein
MSSFVLSSNAGIPFFKILCLSTYIIAYGTEITTETICHLSVAYLLIDCLLLVAIISPKKLFVNPVFPTLPWKIPAVFPVKVTFKTSTKKTAKTQTKKLNYTFTVAKASVALSGDSAVAVGNTTKLTTTKKASDRAKITYTSSDETVATVAADGTVTGVKATITAKLTIGKDTATATHEVEVKNYVLSTVGQSKLTELTATVTGDTKNLKASDFTVKNETTNVVYPVSKVSVDSKDATKVTLTLFSELNDAANYDVTLDGTTKSFKASDGKVASIALDQATIPYATETEVKLVSKDVNGVVLKELTTTDAASDANYNFTIDTKGNGYTNGSKLYLNKVNDTAEATIEYKTGKYDQNGKAEGNIGPNKVTITAVDQAVVNGFDVRIDKATTTKFDKAKDSKKLAVKDPTQYAAFLKIKDANGNEIKDYNKYKVESSDKATLMLGTSTLDPNKHSVNVTAVKAGTAYILIKKDNKIVGSVAVEIVAERTVATLELDSYNVTLSKQLKNTKTVTATVKDQYGDDIAANLSVECLSTDVSNLSTSAVAGSTYYTINGKKVTFNSENVAAGNYVYKISYKNSDNKEVVAKTVSVAVKDAKTTVPDAWRIDVDNNNFDLKVDKDTTADKNIAIQVVGMKDGIDVKYETIKSISVKDAKGNAVVTTTSGSAVLVKAITTATSGSAIVADKKLATGTYSVKATITNNEGKDIELSTTFTVKDTQDKASVDVKDNTVAGATVADAVKNALTVTYGETTYSSRSDKAAADQPLVIAAVEGIKNNGVKFTSGTQTVVSGEYFTITKLAVTVKVDGNVYTNMEVSVPGAITIK